MFPDNPDRPSSRERSAKGVVFLEAVFADTAQTPCAKQKAIAQCKTVSTAIVSGHGQIEWDEQDAVTGYAITGAFTRVQGRQWAGRVH